VWGWGKISFKLPEKGKDVVVDDDDENKR